jgi:excisionase family DNA binding protein
MNSPRRLLSIPEFCDRYSTGRTLTFAEIKARRLAAVKVGRKTLIPEDAAEKWLRSLPAARPVSLHNHPTDKAEKGEQIATGLRR